MGVGVIMGLPQLSLSCPGPLQMGPQLPWVNCDLPPSHLAVSHRACSRTDCLLSCPRACPPRAVSFTKTVLPFHVGACRCLCPLLQQHFPKDPLGLSALCLLLLSGSFYPAVNSAWEVTSRDLLWHCHPSGSAVELCVAPVQAFPCLWGWARVEWVVRF